MNNAALGSAWTEQVRQPVCKSEQGAVAVTVAIVIVVLFSIAALALDIGNAMVARNELQNVADAAALAGARTLGEAYAGLATGVSYASYWTSNSVALTTTAKAAATNVAITNKARQVAIAINAGDITVNYWDTTTRTLRAPNPGSTTEGGTGVRVTARRDSSANGPVATWLAGIMGISSMSITATATAALTGTGVILPGETNAPFGFDQVFFNNPAFCNAPIQFYPTTTSCAGWHAFNETPPNANTLRDPILSGLIPNPPTYTTPQITVGQTSLEYIGGNVASAIDHPAPSNDLIDLFNAKKVPNASSPSGYCWNVTVPVYSTGNTSTCDNPNGNYMTVGAASACVWNVTGPPSMQINATVTCGEVTNGQGGGGNFGTLGSIPGLVE